MRIIMLIYHYQSGKKRQNHYKNSYVLGLILKERQFIFFQHWIDTLNPDESMMPMNNLLILLSNNVKEEIILSNIVPLTVAANF